MKLCIFNASALTQIGGIESHIGIVSKALAEKQIQVSIVSGKGQELNERSKKTNYFVFPYLKRQNAFNKFLSRIIPSPQIESFSFWLFSFRHFLSNKYDVIHIHQPVDAFLFNFLKKFSKAKIVLSVHGFPTQFTKNQMKKCDKVIAVSSLTQNYLKQNHSIDSTVILNPINVHLFKQKKHSDSSFILLAAGRLVEWKGHHFAIKAMPLIKKKIPNAKLVIVGEGEFEKALKEEAKKLNLNGSIEFAGKLPKEKVRNFLSQADVFLQPSIAMEAMPLSLLEAQGAGMACIASNLGGNKEIISNGVNGFLVAPQNEKAIAEKVIQLHSDKKLKKRLETNARNNALKKFDLEKNIQKFIELFSSL